VIVALACPCRSRIPLSPRRNIMMCLVHTFPFTSHPDLSEVVKARTRGDETITRRRITRTPRPPHHARTINMPSGAMGVSMAGAKP
jgi:hypothetical protein